MVILVQIPQNTVAKLLSILFYRLLTRASIATLLLWLLRVPSLAAGDELPWGVTFVNMAHNARGESAVPFDPNTSVSPIEQNGRLEATRAQLRNHLEQLGPYHPDLGQWLLGAAREAEEYGALGTALEWYEKALFNIRINEGLSASSQLVVLEGIMQLLRQQGDSGAVEERLDYYYHLFGNGKPPFNSERLNASVRWLRVSIGLLAGSDLKTHAGRASQIWQHGRDLHDQICNDDRWAREFCKPLTLELINLLYLIDYHIEPVVTSDYGLTTRSRSELERQWSRPPSEQRLLNLERTASTTGVALFELAEKITPDDPELLLAHADWRWFGGNRSAALPHYQRVQQMGAWGFHQPLPLPAVQGIQRDPRLTDEVFKLRAEANITEYGRPKDIVLQSVAAYPSVADSTDGDQSTDGSALSNAATDTIDETVLENARRYARRELRSVRFRPILDSEGQVVVGVWRGEFLLLRR